MLTGSTSSSHPPSTAFRIGIWVAILLALAILALTDYDSFQLGTWTDDATYVGLARALLAPHLHAWLTTHPALATFPPGYPLFLAPLVALFPGSLLVLKLSSLVVTLLCATLLYWGWRWYAPGTSYRWAIVVTGLYAVSALTIEHTRMVMSEPLFTLLSLLALLLAERAARGRARLGPDLALGALLAFSMLVRSVGLILVLTVLAYVAIRQGQRWWATLGVTTAGMVAALALVVWLAPAALADMVPTRYLTGWTTSLPGSSVNTQPAAAAKGSEGTQVAALLDHAQLLFRVLVLGGIVQRFGMDVDSLVLPVGGGSNEAKLAEAIGLPGLPWAISYFVSGLVILGFVACFVRRRSTAFVVFGPVYLALTFVWESAGGRLFHPILPQLILAFLLGVDAVVRGLSAVVSGRALTRARLPFLVVFVILLALLSVRKSLRLPDTRLHVGDLQARSSWLTANSAPSDTLMSEVPAVELVYTNRKTVGYPDGCPSPEELTSYLVANQVDFVLVAPQIRWQEEYMPVFSEHTQCVLEALVALQTEGRAEQVFASEVRHLQVSRIRYD